ncbi:MAG: hypothetical protein AB1601_05705 [Planctomycetota bacterium]
MKRFHALWGVATIVPLAGIGPVVIGQEVLVRDGGAFRQLALATARPFHETTNAIVNVRTLAIPNSDGLAVLWGELGHHGGGPSAFDDRPKSTTARALMINTAFQYDWHVTGPNSNMWRDRQGWGMPDLGRLYANRGKTVVIDEEDLLTPLTFKRYEFFLPTGDPEPELAVTLVYRDPAGNPANQTQHRINDPSLRVVSPAAVEYWGNHGLRDDNWSTPGGTPNPKDTVENVFNLNPQPGVWLVEVHAHELIQDAHLATPQLDAAYGLVIRSVRRTIRGDINGGGRVDFGDINPFVRLLTNPYRRLAVGT